MAENVESFDALGFRVLGGIGIVLLLGVMVVGVFDSGSGIAPWGIALSAFGVVVGWVAMVRPSLRLSDSTLVMRNMVATVTIPLAAIDTVAVQQVVAVRVGDKRYVCAAIGRTRRQLGRDSGRIVQRPPSMFLGGFRGPMAEPPVEDKRLSFGFYVEEKIRGRVPEARSRAGDRVEPVVVRTAWPEIAALVVTALVTVVLILVR